MVFSIIYFLLLSIFIKRGAAEFKQIDLIIHQSYLDPDCFGTSYSALLVNGQFPAPTIRVSKDDEVEIRVLNQADVPTSIHFHGIRQYGTVESDGVPDVTQNAINPGSTFTHRFQLKGQTGTFYYHAHVGVQDDTVQGAFIVENNNSPYTSKTYYDGPYGYDDEFILHLSEWWHQDFFKREEYYLGPGYVHDPNADSVLFNGRTLYRGESSSTQRGCEGHSIFDVLPNRTYRLRVIGGNTFRTYGLGIKDHNMTIIEVDGELIHPYTTTHLEITPGQRFSVLIHTDDFYLRHYEENDGFSNSDNMYAIATSYRHRHRATGHTENGFGFLRYVDYSDNIKHKIIHKNFPEVPENTPRDWIWPYLRPLEPPAPWLYQTPDRTLKIRTWTSVMQDGSTRYAVNGKLSHKISHIYDSHTTKFEKNNNGILNYFTLLKMQSVTPERTFGAMDLDEDGFEPTLGTYPIRLNETVDIVLQNVKSGMNCLLHPWHTHGHSHYVIASGDGEYVHERDHDKRNFPHPIYKDVTVVYETKVDPHTKGCGWTKIRLYADNPGVWAVHCHITAHMLQGKMFLLEEASDWIDTFRMYK
ncbi:multicopper oxidase-domain-containing protein [Absidia repens]|uniref:Multicopper oxidase-domain-containing protein n=1 Tax=Absidia repens TaxID=90262 RepID=A0A1X2ILE2_9FUNG|nr:multicopper oxidase-domain-containing protein [Absidia repens]